MTAPGGESPSPSDPDDPLVRLCRALARLTHDINNPLAIISGNAQLLGELARGGAAQEEVARAALDIEEAAERLALLLRGLSALREEVSPEAHARRE